jgi:hypothetical protein
MECTSYRDAMLDVLYGDATPEAAKRLQEHVAVCGVCGEELQAFRRVRSNLRSYALPAFESARQPRRLGAWPRALLAAAAAVLLALGAGLGRLVQLERRLATQEERHAQEIAALEAALGARGTPAAVATGSDATLQRFEALLKESEARQGRRVEESLRELAERTEAQRRYDLARVSAGLAYLDGRTGQHVARTTELMGHVLQVAEKR